MVATSTEIEDIYPLAPAQEGMLLQTLSPLGRELYVEQIALTLRGPLDAPAFKKVWQQIVQRHGALRTAFHFEDLDNILQVISRRVEVPWIEHDWSALAPTDQRDRLQAFL